MEDQINYVKRSQRDYSMSLKLQIVSEIEKGIFLLLKQGNNMAFRVMVQF